MRLFRRLYRRGSSNERAVESNSCSDKSCFKLKTGTALNYIDSDDGVLYPFPLSNPCGAVYNNDLVEDSVKSTVSTDSDDQQECGTNCLKPTSNSSSNSITMSFGNEIIPYGRAYSRMSNDYDTSRKSEDRNSEHRHSTPTKNLKIVFNSGDILLDDLDVSLYDDIPAYQRLRDIKHNIMKYQQRNSDIKDRLRHLENETKINAARIVELRRENDRLIKENAVSVGKTLDNRFLQSAIDSTKQEVNDLIMRFEDQEQQYLDTIRDCQNYKMKRRHLKSECQALEVISVANNYKAEKLTGQKELLDALWRERRIRLLLTDKLQVEEGHLLVYARVRGSSSPETQKLVHLHLPTNDRIGLTFRANPTAVKPAKQDIRYFRFNFVMGPSTTQEQVFDRLRRVVDTVVDERSACLLTYGAAGSGKTHTLVGQGVMDDRGFLLRAVEHLLRRIADHQFLQIQLSVSFLQIHAEKISCLLSRKKVHLADKNNFISLNGQQQIVVKSSADFCRLLESASRQRICLSTSDKTNQSKDKWMRSLDHMVVFMKLTFTNKLIKDKVERFFVACDLCAFIKTIEEIPSQQSTPINRLDHNVRMNTRALISLQNVIQAINSGSTTVPYRQSVLTHVLRPCLNGSALCATLLTILDDPDAEYSNLQTMQLGQVMMDTAVGNTHIKSETSTLGRFYSF